MCAEDVPLRQRLRGRNVERGVAQLASIEGLDQVIFDQVLLVAQIGQHAASGHVMEMRPVQQADSLRGGGQEIDYD